MTYSELLDLALEYTALDYSDLESLGYNELQYIVNNALKNIPYIVVDTKCDLV